MAEDRVKVAEITGPQAAELRLRDENRAWLRKRAEEARAEADRWETAVAVADNEIRLTANAIVRSLGLPDGPAYLVSAETGAVTAPVAQMRSFATDDRAEKESLT